MSLISSEKSIKNLSKALFSVVSTDKTRLALTGIHYNGDRIFEATDGHKMFRLFFDFKEDASRTWAELVRINPACREVCDGADRLLGKGLTDYVPYPNVKAVVPRITEESVEDYNFDDELRADLLKSWKLLCPDEGTKFTIHLSVWKSGLHSAAVRYDRGCCYGWGSYTICTLLMPIRLDESNEAYSKEYAMKIQSDLLDTKPAEEPKPAEPAEEPKPEAVQPEQPADSREQSLEY